MLKYWIINILIKLINDHKASENHHVVDKSKIYVLKVGKGN